MLSTSKVMWMRWQESRPTADHLNTQSKQKRVVSGSEETTNEFMLWAIRAIFLNSFFFLCCFRCLTLSFSFRIVFSFIYCGKKRISVWNKDGETGTGRRSGGAARTVRLFWVHNFVLGGRNWQGDPVKDGYSAGLCFARRAGFG